MAAIDGLIAILDGKFASAKAECDKVLAENKIWLAETRAQSAKQLLHRTYVLCPAALALSLRLPAACARRLAALAATQRRALYPHR